MKQEQIFDKHEQHNAEVHPPMNRVYLQRRRYVAPQVLSYNEAQILEELGPAQAGSSTNIVGGGGI